MLLKLLFWLLVSLDVLCIGLVFVLGLAAAGPAKTEPLLVLLLLLVVPGAVVGGAVWLFAREATAWRVAATLVVAAPWLWLVVEQVSAQRWIATHPGQIWGSTELTHALYRLPQEPGQLATVRRLLAAGADPNEVGDELPLVLAIRAARTAARRGCQAQRHRTVRRSRVLRGARPGLRCRDPRPAVGAWGRPTHPRTGRQERGLGRGEHDQLARGIAPARARRTYTGNVADGLEPARHLASPPAHPTG
jgi:hypothetical protein